LVFTDESGNVNEMTMNDFEKFRNEYPDVATLLLNPDKITPTHEPEIKERESWEKNREKSVEYRLEDEGSLPFPHSS